MGETSRHRTALSDLALELTAQSTRLRSELPSSVAAALATLVRAMNCYYSNLIEGHDTHPVDIERALVNDFSAEPDMRNLQREATAHIAVQAWIDDGGLAGRATTEQGLCEIHERFCAHLPQALLVVEDKKTGERLEVVPGAYRTRDVQVGRHVGVSPGAVPRFMKRFEEAYRVPGKLDRILSAATAHHRLLWIHPFLDGNGRVARLMSYALLHDSLDTGGLWSVARGLARAESDYKQGLQACDLSRRNDLDGRGQLSEEALADFARFMLETCIDQVSFMRRLMEPDRLRGRILLWAEEESRSGHIPARSKELLSAILYRGEVQRGEVAEIVGASTRTARRTVSDLLARGVVQSASPRAPLQLRFPAQLAGRWMPGL
ncbi:MAG: Fic family protein, partial [Haliea sp.]